METGSSRWWRITLSGLLVALAVTSECFAQSPVFQFAPPDGTIFTETVTTQQTVIAAGATRSRTTELQTLVRIKRLEKGYTLEGTIVRSESAGPSSELGDTLLRAMQATKGKVITYQLDEAGRLLDILGLEALSKAIKSQLPPDTPPSVSAPLEVKELRAGEEADWEDRFGRYLGHPAVVGQSWLATETFPLDPTPVDYYVAVKVVAAERVAGKDCLRVDYRLSRDPADFKAFLVDAYEEVVGDRSRLPGADTVSGDGSRLLDPSTLMSYGGRTERIIKTTFTVPGRGDLLFEIRHAKRYEYAYEWLNFPNDRR